MPTLMNNGYFCALSAVVIWSGFILVSRSGGISELSAYDIIAIRYLTAGVVLLPIWLIWSPFNILHTRFILLGIVGGLAYATLAFKGFELTPASHAAILLPGALPLLIVFLTALIGRQKHSNSKWLGASTITLGIGILMNSEMELSPDLTAGHLLLISSAVCWALFSVLLVRWQIKPWEATISLVIVTCILFIPFYLLFLPTKISLGLVNDIALQSVYQGILATIIQMLFYVRAVQLIGAANMGAMMAVVPILTSVIAIPFFGESFGLHQIISMALVSVGVLITNLATAPPKKKRLALQTS